MLLNSTTAIGGTGRFRLTRWNEPVLNEDFEWSKSEHGLWICHWTCRLLKDDQHKDYWRGTGRWDHESRSFLEYRIGGVEADAPVQNVTLNPEGFQLTDSERDEPVAVGGPCLIFDSRAFLPFVIQSCFLLRDATEAFHTHAYVASNQTLLRCKITPRPAVRTVEYLFIGRRAVTCAVGDDSVTLLEVGGDYAGIATLEVN